MPIFIRKPTGWAESYNLVTGMGVLLAFSTCVYKAPMLSNVLRQRYPVEVGNGSTASATSSAARRSLASSRLSREPDWTGGCERHFPHSSQSARPAIWQSGSRRSHRSCEAAHGLQ
jgi:hypothetical protein